jgi:mono/diheme cytochrome c family protein
MRLWTTYAILVLLTALVGCSETKTPVANAKTESDAPAAVAAKAADAGKAVYDTRCASCHTLGSYDTEGTERDLSRRGKKMTVAFVAAHTGSSINDEELANLKAFLAAH